MSQNKLRKLKKKELLEIILEQNQRNDLLMQEIEKAKINYEQRSSGLPSNGYVEDELREINNRGLGGRLKSFFRAVLVLIAVLVILLILVMPSAIMKDASMSPSVNEKDIVLSLRFLKVKQNELVTVKSDDKNLIRRCAAVEGQTVDIDSFGNLYIDDKIYKYDCISQKTIDATGIKFPYVVPEDAIFAVADDCDAVADGVNEFGSYSKSDIKGKVAFKLYPFKEFGAVEKDSSES